MFVFAEKFRRQSKENLEDWKVTADTSHRLCGFGAVVLCSRCGTVGEGPQQKKALAKTCKGCREVGKVARVKKKLDSLSRGVRTSHTICWFTGWEWSPKA